MTTEQVASLLLLLAPVWPLLAAVVLSFGRRPRTDEDVPRVDREHRTVAAAAACLSCGSLLTSFLLGSGATFAPAASIIPWLTIPAPDIQVAFQLRLDTLSGPAAIAASLLSFVAIVSARRTESLAALELPPYRAWMALLCAVQIVLLANDAVLMIAGLLVAELLCVMLVSNRLSWVRALTLLPFVWIAAQWVVGFQMTRIILIANPNEWVIFAAREPVFTLVSGLCLLTCVIGRSGNYPFCIDVDRIYDSSPGRLFWYGCLGSWIPAQYLLLRFWPVLGVSPLGVPSLTGLAILLSILAAWMALTRPHRAGALAMIGAGMISLTWTSLGSGHQEGLLVAAGASLTLIVLFGGLVILVDSQGWLAGDPTGHIPGRPTLWVTLFLLASGIGAQHAWEVTYASSQAIEVETSPPDETGTEVSPPAISPAIPIVMILAHTLLWLAAARVLSPILLGQFKAAKEVSPLPAENDVVIELPRADETSASPALKTIEPEEPRVAASWLSRRLCGGVVLCAVLWGPAGSMLLRRRGNEDAANALLFLTSAPWGVMLPAGLLGLVLGCWFGFAARSRPTGAAESWQKLADAGRRLFYLPEMGRFLTLPFRQMLELPAILESLRTPTAEIITDEAASQPGVPEPLLSHRIADWLLPLAGLTSIALIWILLLQ